MTRPLPRSVHATGQTLASLVAAIPRTWVIDRVFRIAVLAAGIALATLMARPLIERTDPATPSQQEQEATSPASPLPPPGARYAAPDALAVTGEDPARQIPSGPIVPGRTLDGLRIEPDPDATPDPFGTPGAADPRSGKTP